MNSLVQAAASAMFLALGAQNTVLDSHGNAVATLVAKTPVTQTVSVAKPAPAPQWPDQIVFPMLFGGGAGE